MSIIEIASLFLFPISLASFQLAVEQEKTAIEDRIGMFRSEVFGFIVMLPSFMLMIASTIILLIHSWILYLCLFVGTAIAYTFGGRYILIQMWYIPYKLIDAWAKKKNTKND